MAVTRSLSLPLALVVSWGLACGGDDTGTSATTAASSSGASSGSSVSASSDTGEVTTSEVSTGVTQGSSSSTTSATSEADSSGSSTSSGSSDSSGTAGTTGGTQTPCGGESCDRASEICVERAKGGPSLLGCEPVPAGCEADRTCACVGAALCTVGLASCTDVVDNHVFCDSGLD